MASLPERVAAFVRSHCPRISAKDPQWPAPTSCSSMTPVPSWRFSLWQAETDSEKARR